MTGRQDFTLSDRLLVRRLIKTGETDFEDRLIPLVHEQATTIERASNRRNLLAPRWAQIGIAILGAIRIIGLIREPTLSNIIWTLVFVTMLCAAFALEPIMRRQHERASFMLDVVQKRSGASS